MTRGVRSLRYLVVVLVAGLCYTAACRLASALPGPDGAQRFVVTLDFEQLGPPVSDPTRCAPPYVVVRIAGRGHGIRMGRVTADMSHCIIDDPAAVEFIDGRLTLTAASGDQVFATYSGVNVPAAGGLNLLEGTFTITGGTGRFAGATGGGTLTGTADPATGTGSGVLDGTIVLAR
jgi:hypothetical protein